MFTFLFNWKDERKPRFRPLQQDKQNMWNAKESTFDMGIFLTGHDLIQAVDCLFARPEKSHSWQTSTFHLYPSSSSRIFSLTISRILSASSFQPSLWAPAMLSFIFSTFFFASWSKTRHTLGKGRKCPLRCDVRQPDGERAIARKQETSFNATQCQKEGKEDAHPFSFRGSRYWEVAVALHNKWLNILWQPIAGVLAGVTV